MKIMSYILVVECLICILFTVSVYIAFLAPLWDLNYMKQIVADFE